MTVLKFCINDKKYAFKKMSTKDQNTLIVQSMQNPDHFVTYVDVIQLTHIKYNQGDTT